MQRSVPWDKIAVEDGSKWSWKHDNQLPQCTSHQTYLAAFSYLAKDL